MKIPFTKKLRLLALSNLLWGLGVFFGPGSLLAQQQVQITAFNVNAPYSNLISDYISGFNQRVTIMVNATGKTEMRLAGTLKSNTGVLITLPAQYNVIQPYLAQPITVQQGAARITAAQIGNLFSSDPSRDNSTIALKRDLFGNYILPEGDYEACIRAYQFNGSNALSDEVCTSFSIRNIEPPYLLLPQDKDTLQTATATYQPHQFSWTFPAGATPTQIEYVLQIAELRQGQNPYNVFESGPLFAEIVVPNASPLYILKATDPRFELGHTYAWRVKVQGKGRFEGLVNFQNKGLSTVNVFTYGPVKTTSGDNLVTSSEKVVGTKKKADSSAVAFTPVSGSCTCKIVVSTNTKLKTDLDNSQTVYIGNKDGYQLSISTLDKVGDTYTGTGTVALGLDFTPTGRSRPFIPVQVTFSGVKINTDNILIAGQVQSKKRKDIGFGPELAPAPATPNAPSLPPTSDLKSWLLKSADEKSLAPAWKGLKDKIANEYESYKQQAVQQVNQQVNGAGIATPFGYSSGVFTVAVDNIVFTPTTAQYDAFSVLEVNDLNVSVPLGLMGACLPLAGCQSQPVLYLLKDTDIPYTAQTLSLKGGTDPANSTYLAYKANGNDNVLNIVADVSIPNATLVDGGAPAKARLVANTKDGFENWQASASIAGAFRFDDLGDFTFKLGAGAVYDHDINNNPAGFNDVVTALRTSLKATTIQNPEEKLMLLDEKAWQGFYMPELSITLPSVFQKTDGKTTTVATATVRNMVIGKSLGLTGALNAENVINYNDGSLDGWYFSLDKIGITFFDGTFVNANADGKIGLPISDNNVQSALAYTNTLTSDGSGLKYVFNIKPQSDINVPIWAAKFTLSEASTIQVTVGKTDSNPQGGVWAGADLSGKLTLNVDFIPKAVGVKMPSFDLGLMEFQHLKIQSKGPKYIDWGDYKSQALDGAGKALQSSPFAGAFASPQKGIMGLPLTIEQFGPVMEGQKVGFAFTGALALSDIQAIPKASASLRVLANIGLSNGRPNWSFDAVYLDSVKVSGAIGPMNIAGALWFYRSHADYGDGLGGSLAATFPMNISVGADVRFGTWKDKSYWYVGAMAAGLSVPVGAGLKITGFGGGAYHNMTAPTPPKANQLLASAGKLNYKPSTAGSNGFTASVYLATLDGSILKADGTLGVQFDQDWGLDQISITANAHLVCADVGISDKVKQGMADGTASIVYKVPDRMFDLGAQVTASVAEMVELTGTLAVHVGPDGYYIKLGEPHNRIKVRLMAPGIGISLGEATSYFVMGTLDMPSTLPDPVGIDPALLAQVGYRKPAVDFKSGLAFGSALEIGSTDKQRFLIFYLKLHAGIGFDVIMGKTQGNCTAADRGGQPGINGYYAMGQIYAGVDFSFGVGVDLWFVSGDFDVATIRAGAIFTGGLPNPTWMRGILYGDYDILDGLVSGKMSFRLKIGDVCIPDTDTNPFKMPLIAGISPGNNEKAVSILKNPVVTFNYPVNQDICVSKPINENGDLATDCYKVEFTMTTKCGEKTAVTDAYSCTDCNAEVIPNNQIFFAQRGTEASFYKEKAFSPSRQYSLTVQAIAYRKLYNEAEFKRFRDTTITVSFTSGECIKTLSRSGADKTIAASYPFSGQRFLLQKEYGGRGFIQLVQDFSCCLRGNESLVTTVAEFSDAFGGSVLAESPVTFENKLIRFDIPKLPHEKVIQLRILQKPTADAQQLARNQSPNLPNRPNLGTTNNYISQPNGGIEFASVSANVPTMADPTSSKGTVVSTATMPYRVVREPVSQRLIPELKPVVLTEYYFRTSRYDNWAAKLGDRRQDETEVVLQKNKTYPKLEEATASFDLTEDFDVFDVGQSSERLDINMPTDYGPAKTSVQYPALITMREVSRNRTFEGVSFQMTDNSWFTTHALPVYQRAIHLQTVATKVDSQLLYDLVAPYRNGRELLRVSAMNLYLSPKPSLSFSEIPLKLVVAPTMTSTLTK